MRFIWQPVTDACDERLNATADQDQAAITSADGNYDIFEHLKLSGEPLIPQLIPDFPDGKPGPVYNAIEVEKTALKLNEYRVRYRDYWRSTANDTSTGKINQTPLLDPWHANVVLVYQGGLSMLLFFPSFPRPP